MRTARTSGHDRDAERDLVGELARAVVERVAPEELGLFEETEADYFRDPGLVLRAGRRDEAVGFGLDLALLTSSSWCGRRRWCTSSPTWSPAS